MNRKMVDTVWLGISIFFFLMFAVSFLLMPLESEVPTENTSVYSLVAGLMFWSSIIMVIVTQCVLAFRRKYWFETHRIRKVRASQKIGVISFFENIYATVADIVSILSFIGFIVSTIVTHGTGYICYVLLSLFVFSFGMHCVLNGRIYYYVVNQNKYIQAVEKEQTNLFKQERKA